MAAKSVGKDLAIFGAQPAFVEQLHVGRPNIGDRAALMQRLNGMLDRQWLTNNGVLVREFEGRIARIAGVKHAVVMCNATIALEIAIRALDLSGEVIVPSFTFVATAHALQWQGITPVFCDVDPRTHSIDPKAIERLITPRTTGIIGVHLWGEPCDVDALAEIAARNKLKLLYDAAHAFGCSRGTRMIGSFGEAEVFSFHATKFLNSFEGGAVVTNDDALAARIRFMQNFGFAGYDRVDYVGTNGKMTEACAAMGLTSLDSMGLFLEQNRLHQQHYREALAGIPGLTPFPYGQDGERNLQYVIFEIDEAQTGLSRDELVAVLHAENVLARRYFHPGCHRMEPYRSYFPNAGLLLPNTERLTGRVLALPNGTGVSSEEVGKVAALIKLAIANAPGVRARLAERAAAHA
jgi:dTDP-4-amino-4,6-dideoxygalactose transaminase